MSKSETEQNITISQAFKMLDMYIWSYKDLPEHLKENYQICLYAVKKYGLIIEYIPHKFRNDFNIVKTALLNHSSSFKFASEELKDNREIVLSALQLSIHNFQFISSRLKKDYDFIKILINKYFWGFQYLDIDFIKDDLNIQIFLIKKVHTRQINRVLKRMDYIHNLSIIKNYIDTPKMFFDLPLYKKQHLWSRLMNVIPILLCFERYSRMVNIELPSELIYMILGYFKLDDFISI
jgi:hypothetical protein